MAPESNLLCFSSLCGIIVTFNNNNSLTSDNRITFESQRKPPEGPGEGRCVSALAAEGFREELKGGERGGAEKLMAR